MKTNVFVKTLLIISGIIGMGVGYALLFFPVAFEASAGITLGKDVNLLSEIRTPGGLLLAGGAIIFFGAFYSKLTYQSMLLSSLIYLSYGLARLVGIIMDGFPSESLMIAMIAELVIGLLSLFVSIRLSKQRK